MCISVVQKLQAQLSSSLMRRLIAMHFDNEMLILLTILLLEF